jgi:L-ascorbate metabolism protein UlaG (beta-lactamase superfamily)
MKNYLFPLLILSFVSFKCYSHDQQSTATYLGNEAVMVENESIKILFDPFFHNNYGQYQLVPEEIRQALFNNQAPYDNIDAIFVSHAHGDHFAADDMLKYLIDHPHTKFIAPNQAVDKLLALNNKIKNGQSIINQTISIDLNREDKPKRIEIDGLLIEAVRIPHAGWPGRAEISNLVFRVTLNKNVTVMHMGDADPNDLHFKQYESYWKENLTNTAFPPYWFFASKQGPFILNERINTEQSVGIHVPVNVPDSLKKTGKAYFSKPAEQKSVGHKHRKLKSEF